MRVTHAMRDLSRDTKYLSFEFRETTESGKTQIYDVRSIYNGGILGEIMWFGRWRQYAFFPAPNTVFNVDCLNDIRKFILDLAKQRSDDHEH